MLENRLPRNKLQLLSMSPNYIHQHIQINLLKSKWHGSADVIAWLLYDSRRSECGSKKLVKF